MRARHRLPTCREIGDCSTALHTRRDASVRTARRCLGELRSTRRVRRVCTRHCIVQLAHRVGMLNGPPRCDAALRLLHLRGNAGRDGANTPLSHEGHVQRGVLDCAVRASPTIAIHMLVPLFYPSSV